MEDLDSNGDPVAGEQRIVIHLGMELTLGIPCQALMIFDAGFPNDMFSLVISRLAINAPDPSTCTG